jgi:hypothetical protein
MVSTLRLSPSTLPYLKPPFPRSTVLIFDFSHIFTFSSIHPIHSFINFNCAIGANHLTQPAAMKFNPTVTLLLLSSFCALNACSNKVPVATSAEKQTIDSLSYLAAIEQQQLDNKKLVADFYQELYGDKNTDAIDKYLDSNYIQHNPNIGDGKESLSSIQSVV